MDDVVLFSGGLGSWAAAKRVAELNGTRNLKLLFTDTKTEDEDLYRFIKEAAENVGGELITLCDGRDIWKVFFDVKFLGNSRIDPCSRILKRDLSEKWFKDNYEPTNVTRYVGIDWTEEHRFTRIKDRVLPWVVKAPLCDPPYLTKNQIKAWLAAEGIKLPRLYEMGFDHNNCGGFCVKAGHAHFKKLLQVMPARYAYHEQKEREFREYTGADVSVMLDRRGGTKKPLTMEAFRLRMESNGECDPFDIGGCSCFAGPEDDVAA